MPRLFTRPHFVHQGHFIRGFTLLELMIVLAITVIVVTLTAPYLQDFYREHKIKLATTDIVNALESTRSEALKRNMPVDFRLTFVNNEVKGYKIHENPKIETSYTNQPIVAEKTAADLDLEGIIITAQSSGSGNLDFVRFDGSGFASGGANGRIKITNKNGTGLQWQIVINRLGRVRSCSTSKHSEDC